MKDYGRIFGANMRARRRELGLTQRALGERIGYSEKAVSKWESGAALPPSALLPRLADALQTGIDELMHEQAEIQWFLGVDGGGTKTEFVLTDRAGAVLEHARLGAINPNDVGLAAACEVLNRGILTACGTRPRNKISAFVGIAGGISGDNRRAIGAFLEQYRFGACRNGSDAENAVAAALGASDGVAVILGTGAIAFSQKNGETQRHGGYGYLFGDAGSGFSLGRDAIVAALHDEDGSGAHTALTERLRRACESDTVLEKLALFYAQGKRTVASYAPLVFEAAESGDAVAREILSRNMQEVGALIRHAARGLEAPIRVVLCGGIASHAAVLTLLKEQFDKTRYQISVCERPMWQGALRLAGLEEPSC
ncbi:MAG: helix-turn-helix domain-containing protein [Clostridia bacterium]|nr:helix-turn-helix domain-containing protein [Clostridia bacterium]